MGYRLVQSVLVVTLGRIGDMYGRVRVYNFGFTVFTVASILLSFDPFAGAAAAQWLIGWRLLQAVGGSMLTANSAAILTDAFPPDRRGFALGFNQVAALAGTVHRPGGRGTAGRMGLAGGVLGERACRCVRHHLGVPAPARQRRTAPRPHRLVGQHHIRCRAVRGSHRDHQRHPTARRPPDRLAEPVRPGNAGGRDRSADRVRRHRISGRRTDDPTEPVQDPGVQRGQHGDAGGGPCTGRPAVHADHLATGHLAAAARLRLCRHTACGRASSCCR